MKQLLFLLLSLLLINTIAFPQQEATTTNGKKVLLYDDMTWKYANGDTIVSFSTNTISKLEIPKLKPNEYIINHTGYSLSYNETHEQASWVAYELTDEETKSKFERTDKFIIDPMVKTGSANDADFMGSKMDRGHLCPAGDQGWSATTMAESFYYSNMSPQEPSFNRGIWKKLEELVRTWAVENKSIYIVTGGVLTDGLPTIGSDKVSVPKYFYKVILDYTEPEIKGIGLILPNAGSKEPLQSFVVTIDSVEKITGIDFFPLLPYDQERAIESTVNIDAWSWKSSQSSNEKPKASTSVQCQGLTKKGVQCKNSTLNLSGYCYLHESQDKGNNSGNIEPTTAITTTKTTTTASQTKSTTTTSVQCSATTKKGARCKNMTKNANGRCGVHQ